MLILVLLIIFPQKSHAIDPRVKVLGTVALYGTVGGTLLGIASLAFGTSGRSVAQGASLGLYAGLLFGGYIVFAHYQRNIEAEDIEGDYPDDSTSPYGDQSVPQTGMEEDQGGGGQFEDEGGGEEEYERWNPYMELKFKPASLPGNYWGSKRPDVPLVYFNLLQINF